MDPKHKIITGMVVLELGNQPTTWFKLKELYREQQVKYESNPKWYDLVLLPDLYSELANAEFCFVLADSVTEASTVSEGIFGPTPAGMNLTDWFRASLAYILKLSHEVRDEYVTAHTVYAHMLEADGVSLDDLYNVCTGLSYAPMDVLSFLSTRYEKELFTCQ